MASNNKSNWAFVQDLLLGGTSGVIAKTICAPLERVKIVLQTQEASHQILPEQKYKGILDAFVRIPKEQGVLSFWRGNFTNCVRYFPTQAINFACKEQYEKLFVRPRAEVGFAKWFMGYLAAGGAAGATCLLFVYPLDFSYTRLAADVGQGANRQFTGLANCMATIFKNDGIRGLYRGFLPSVSGIIVYRAGYFGFFGAGKQVFFGDNQNVSLLKKFALALSVETSAALVAYPLDTVRRRLMMQSGLAEKDMLYKSSVQCLQYIVKHEGATGLYKGAGMNAIRGVASALVLVLYDELKQFFGLNAGPKKH